MKNFEQLLADQLAAEQKKNKHKEWGKLGGRPRIENRKTEKITLRFTPSERNLLLSKSKNCSILIHWLGFKSNAILELS